MSLRLMRPVTSDANIFIAILMGDLYWVRRLLTEGQASVVDISENGRTPLHVGYNPINHRRLPMYLGGSNMQ